MMMGMLGATLATLHAACLLAVPPPALAADHVVGGSGWCIPPSAGLYRAWADNRTFFVGDTLVFRFETGFHDVVQVGRREYEECTADDPYQIFRAGPAAVPLDSTGVRYYVCTVGNYCSLGVRLYVTVQRR
ncbi:hypothetical protein SEVIR_9G154100v4 [Setaria viridis]|uniref:Phytocyanin domain-containing protein n=1 Tax=Setaria viridis TaxID=4556 RepID=A0A4U6SU36_SETVI|nr:umecyanin-like [Setaria viridis]XP_034574928.1 umecyanin-like [Setaria viridis]TKV92279.1 hypothetical protein SEVIR_9G154100v2 [Setaria viridis]